MPKKKTQLDRFAGLTWNDLEEWAGSKIVSRGKRYQCQGHVRELAVTQDHGLIAWVDGTKRYATQVVVDEGGLLDSICTCPYQWECKHAVAVVIDYLKRLEGNQPVCKASRDDARLTLLMDEEWEDQPMDEDLVANEDLQEELTQFLKAKKKAQLIELIMEVARQRPEVAQDILDRRQLASGQTKALVARLRREIQEVGSESGWQDYWRGEGYTPDYSGIRKKMETLLAAGHADEVLALGHELVITAIRQVEESHDDGETGMEIADCMEVIVNALDRSSQATADKLYWAVDAELQDQYGVFEVLAEYLHRKHPKLAWHSLSDRLLLRLKAMKPAKGAHGYSYSFQRDRLTDWLIHALDQAGRKDEIVPLCEAEVKKTGNYERLVNQLVAARRDEEAERWIREGIRATQAKWPGVASGLRKSFLQIRIRQKNWPVVAAVQAEGFVRRPSQHFFTECKKAADKVKAWPDVRKSLLHYLETGDPPWKQDAWSLPESGLDLPEPEPKKRFPMVNVLIEMALLEKKPEQILYWYAKRPDKQYGYGVDLDTIATAVSNHAPDQAVAIWQKKAERCIARVKPKAYREAGRYLRKAAKVLSKQKKQAEWDRYLQRLRAEHARKIRLMEVLDGLDNRPILKKRSR